MKPHIVLRDGTWWMYSSRERARSVNRGKIIAAGTLRGLIMAYIKLEAQREKRRKALYARLAD
jgi:hypothetical protein